MNRPNITPGPWKDNGFINASERIVIESDAAQVAEVYYPSCYLTRNANARAIAAVPALLEALEIIHANAAESPEWIRRHTTAALIAAGYQF